jgi:ABC-type nitrate/sulfonate/bicarbonate transport system permease component
LIDGIRVGLAWRTVAPATVAVVVIVAVWSLVARLMSNPTLLPSPLEVLWTLVNLISLEVENVRGLHVLMSYSLAMKLSDTGGDMMERAKCPCDVKSDRGFGL